jgi:hypothetical protein
MNKKEISKLLQNSNTKVLVEWLDGMLKMSNKYIMSDQFFHSTHSEKDRELLLALLMNFFDSIDSIQRVGKSGVMITKK